MYKKNLCSKCAPWIIFKVFVPQIKRKNLKILLKFDFLLLKWKPSSYEWCIGFNYSTSNVFSSFFKNRKAHNSPHNLSLTKESWKERLLLKRAHSIHIGAYRLIRLINWPIRPIYSQYASYQPIYPDTLMNTDKLQKAEWSQPIWLIYQPIWYVSANILIHGPNG